MCSFWETLVHWEGTNVFVDVTIEGIAHDKAPSFYNMLLEKTVNCVTAAMGNHTCLHH